MVSYLCNFKPSSCTPSEMGNSTLGGTSVVDGFPTGENKREEKIFESHQDPMHAKNVVKHTFKSAFHTLSLVCALILRFLWSLWYWSCISVRCSSNLNVHHFLTSMLGSKTWEPLRLDQERPQNNPTRWRATVPINKQVQWFWSQYTFYGHIWRFFPRVMVPSKKTL